MYKCRPKFLKKMLSKYISDQKFGSMSLFFGCRNNQDNIFKNELLSAKNKEVLADVQFALSRDPSSEKVGLLHK